MNLQLLKLLAAGRPDLHDPNGIGEEVYAVRPRGEHPVIAEWRSFLRSNPKARMLLIRAIEEARAADDKCAFSDPVALLDYLNAVLQTATPWSDGEAVGGPLIALFQPILLVPAGYQLFRLEAFNELLRHTLRAWYHFLESEASCRYLNTVAPLGWFSAEANDKVRIEEYVCHPEQPYYGFRSWNDFFQRKFKADARPVAGAGDARVITAGCEAATFKIAHNVAAEAPFWIKSQPYSLRDMLQREAHVDTFAGGTVMQGFLAGYNYHRWHAPVSGVVTDLYVLEGTYFSAAEAVGEAGMTGSQPYLAAMAARLVLVLDTQDARIGKVGLVYVGMAEVSGVVATVNIGQRLTKGDETGYFQYGGSSYCLLLEPGVDVEFTVEAADDVSTAEAVRLNTQIARVGPRLEGNA